jgi:poly(3-hydroxybutyrate) depolymerase
MAISNQVDVRTDSPHYDGVGPRLRDGARALLGIVASLGFVASAFADAKNAPSEPRFIRKVYVGAGNVERGYLVFLPRDFSPSDRRPALIFLNGTGENGTDGYRQISNNFGVDVWRMRDAVPFVVVAPQGGTGGWSAMEILNEVEREYRTDPDRVYLTGVSSGGSGVWQIAAAHSERFAAIASLCGFGGDVAQVLVEANLPVWSFYNDGDSAQIVDSYRQLRGKLIGLGASPLATEYEGLQHNCWTRAYATEALYAWFLKHDRKKNQAGAAKFAVVEPATVLAEWDRRGNAAWHVDDDDPATLVCSARGASERGAVIGPTSTDDWEMHVDARTDGPTFRIGLFGQADAVDSMLVLTIPFAERGLGGLSTPAAGETQLTSITTLTPDPSPVEGEGRDTAEGEGRNPDHDGSGSTPVGERLIARLDPVGQRQLNAKGWNDLRITKRADRLSLSINGWPGLDCQVPLIRAIRRFGLQSPSTTTEGTVRWRYLRWRAIGAKDAVGPESAIIPHAASNEAFANPHPSPPRERGGSRLPPVRGGTEGGQRLISARAEYKQTGGVSSPTNGEKEGAQALSRQSDVAAGETALKSIDLNSVIAAWRDREAAFPVGEVQWTIRRNDLTRFGGYPHFRDGAEQEDGACQTLLFDGAHWRFDGGRFSPGIGAIAATDTFDGFREALIAGTLPRYTPRESAVRSTEWKIDGRSTQLWKEPGVSFNRAIIETPLTSESIARDSAKPGPDRIDRLLFEGILLALRPYSSGPLAVAADQCRLIEDDASTAGKTRVILERKFDSTGGPRDEHVRQYWLDPNRGFAIERVVDLWNGAPAVQLDNQYTSVAPDNAVPGCSIAMTMDGNRDATSYVYADWTAATREPDRLPERLEVDLPAETRVADRTQRRNYIIKADGRHVELEDENASGHFGLAWRMIGAAVRKSLRTSLSWPGILITLSCLSGAGWGLRRMAEKRRFRREAT